MAVIIHGEGLTQMLGLVVNRYTQDDVVLHLFNNDITPDSTTAYSAFSEPTDTSYAPITLTGSSWTVGPSMDAALAEYAPVDFTFDAGDSVYGWYLTNNAGNIAYFSERFPSAPFVVPGGGGTITVTLSISLDECSP